MPNNLIHILGMKNYVGNDVQIWVGDAGLKFAQLLQL